MASSLRPGATPGKASAKAIMRIEVAGDPATAVKVNEPSRALARRGGIVNADTDLAMTGRDGRIEHHTHWLRVCLERLGKSEQAPAALLRRDLGRRRPLQRAEASGGAVRKGRAGIAVSPTLEALFWSDLGDQLLDRPDSPEIVHQSAGLWDLDAEFVLDSQHHIDQIERLQPGVAKALIEIGWNRQLTLLHQCANHSE